MKKSDLKVGYLVEVRNCCDGNFGIIMPISSYNELNICRYNCRGISNLESYNEDLTNIHDKNYDIIRVWGYAALIGALTLETRTRKLLWERKEKIKITLELTDKQIESLKKQGFTLKE